jgi:hypothetical protein
MGLRSCHSACLGLRPGLCHRRHRLLRRAPKQLPPEPANHPLEKTLCPSEDLNRDMTVPQSRDYLNMGDDGGDTSGGDVHALGSELG